MKWSAFIILMVLGGGITAQDGSKATLDSLLAEAKVETDSLKRLEKLLSYTQQLHAYQTDDGIAFLDSLILDFREREYKFAEARALSLQSWLLNFQAQYEKALRLAHQALKIQQKINDTTGVSLTLNRIGVTNLYFQRFDDAAKYLKLALSGFQELNDTLRIDMVLNNLGVLYSDKNQPEMALDYYRQSLTIRKKQERYHWVAFSYYNIGNAFLTLNQLDSAQKYMEQAIYYFKFKAPRKRVPALAASGIAEVYLARKNFASAIKWSREALAKAEAVNHKEVKIIAHKILAEALYESGNFKEAYQNQKRYQQLKEEADSVNNHAEVAEIEARYETARQQATIARLEAEKYEAQSDRRQLQLWFLAVAVMVLILGFVAFTFYQKKLRNQHLAQSELKARVSEMRILALRAQMNPHFIFNCINTAQNFVLNSEKQGAYEYLSKFAKLLRLVLENSEKSTVPLDDELHQIKLYAELEQVRFENRFEFNIELDDELNQGVFEIPGMILQPIVENAIIHGIINRNDNKGQLKIKLTKQASTITCEITDNGIGRTRAAELKNQKEVHYQSAALPNIHKRLETMRSKYSADLDISIVDLTEAGQPAGTKVIVVLPFG